MANETPTYSRVMLLLPAEQAAFVDRLAATLSAPGLPVNRQTAIRTAIAKLQAAMEPPAPVRRGARARSTKRR